MVGMLYPRKDHTKKLHHPTKPGVLIVPDHGNAEMGKGLERKIMKDAGI
jgi:mRNA interferase HicA